MLKITGLTDVVTYYVISLLLERHIQNHISLHEATLKKDDHFHICTDLHTVCVSLPSILIYNCMVKSIVQKIKAVCLCMYVNNQHKPTFFQEMYYFSAQCKVLIQIPYIRDVLLLGLLSVYLFYSTYISLILFTQPLLPRLLNIL